MNVLGYGWRLVIGDASLVSPATRDRIVITRIGHDGHGDTDGIVQNWMNNHGCSAAVVRPDHYVFGVASSLAELESRLDEWESARSVLMSVVSPIAAAAKRKAAAAT